MKVAIVGLGLIGGSIGLALKRSGTPDLRIVGIPRREETLKQALAMGAIDRGLDVIKKEGTQESLLDVMQHRKDLYALLRYEDYNSFDQNIFNFTIKK